MEDGETYHRARSHAALSRVSVCPLLLTDHVLARHTQREAANVRGPLQWLPPLRLIRRPDVLRVALIRPGEGRALVGCRFCACSPTASTA